MRGHFIVLEGPDGSGTTSHSKRLAEALMAKGVDVLHTFEATDGPIGTYIRSHLKLGDLPGSAIQLLFTADRAWHVRNVLEPALQAGKTIICDRYSLSTIIYGTAQGEDRAWLEEMNKKFIQPDLLLYALPPFSVCMERLGKRIKDSFESDDSLQKRVYDLYQQAARGASPDTVFDTSGDAEETAAAILAQVERTLI